MKYGNKKTEVDGYLFDSRKEAHHYLELKYMLRAGMIQNLRLQVPFVLIPPQKDEKGKVIERAVVYKADFVYEQNGETVVVDTKGFKTKEYIIKRKLMLERYGYRIKEV